MRLLKIFVAETCRAEARVPASSVTNVVTLIPPAVEPGAPPMIMRIIISAADAGDSAASSTVLNPAVRAVTELKKAVSILSPKGIVFPDSKRRKSTAPEKRRIPVMTSTTLVWSVNFFGSNRQAKMSCQTMKPTPPQRISAMITRLTVTSPA